MSEETPVYLEEYNSMHPADLADQLQRMDMPKPGISFRNYHYPKRLMPWPN